MSENIIKAWALEVKLGESEAKVYEAQIQIRELKDKYSSSKQYSLEREEEIRNLKVKVGELESRLKVVKQNLIISPKVSEKIIEDYKAYERLFL